MYVGSLLPDSNFKELINLSLLEFVPMFFPASGSGIDIFCNLGINTAANIAITAITTTSSTKVKPFLIM